MSYFFTLSILTFNSLLLLSQCERGTALHEAAMCGKTDTVQLLLDKGTNLELKDGQGRTVVDLLAEYPADKAKEICRMIQSKN